MTVLNVINVRWYNATAWYAITVANAGAKYGDKHIISSTPNAPVLTVADSCGIDNFALNYNSSNPITILKTIVNFLRKIKEINPDYIVAHRGEFFIFVAMIKLLSRNAKWKLIRVRGDSRPPTSDIISRFIHNKITSAVIVPSKTIYNYFIDRLKSNREHVHIIYGGVDKNIFRENKAERDEIRTEFGYTNADYVIAIIGRLDPVKGHDIFLKACSKLYHENRVANMKLLIVGHEENIKYSMLNEMIEENGVEKISTVTGRRNDIPKILNAIDLAVIASNSSESIARVAFEILATDKDLIASNVGVLPEIIDSENIFHFNDFNELADKIVNHKKQTRKYYDDEFYNKFRNVLTTS